MASLDTDLNTIHLTEYLRLIISMSVGRQELGWEPTEISPPPRQPPPPPHLVRQIGSILKDGLRFCVAPSNFESHPVPSYMSSPSLYLILTVV